MTDDPEPPTPRPTFTVGRVADGGRLSLDRVLDLARLSLGRELTADEIAEARALWRERFPDDPATREPR